MYIPLAPVNDEARKHNRSLPGMGGVYNLVNLQLYHYAGNNPVKYTDPDGRISLLSVVLANPDRMSRTDARNWIIKEVVNDNRYPVCQILYSLGLLGYTGTYDITNNSVITDKLAAADNYANKTIRSRLVDGIISGSNGTTAFKKTDTDLYGAFGGGVSFSWSVDSIDENTGTVNVKVHITDTFDFNEGGGKRDFWGEKLTSIGRKAGLSSFRIEGSYILSVKLSSEQIKAIEAQIND